MVVVRTYLSSHLLFHRNGDNEKMRRTYDLRIEICFRLFPYAYRVWFRVYKYASGTTPPQWKLYCDTTKGTKRYINRLETIDVPDDFTLLVINLFNSLPTLL